MTTEAFNRLLNERFDMIKHTLMVKAEQYATGGDRMYNFKRAAEILRCGPEHALLGIASKHFVSILDIVDDIEKGALPLDLGLWNEKMGDWINYMALLDIMVRGKINVNIEVKK